MTDTSTERVVMLNGKPQSVPSDGRRLIEWLRDDMELCGTKEPCGMGQCGACSVLLDGNVVLACCVLAATTAGHEVQTIEGIADRWPPDPLIDAFARCGATQCGYCTPGMLVSARALLDSIANDQLPSPLDERAVRSALAGNICRCTGYVQIVEAVLSAARSQGIPCVAESAPAWQIVHDIGACEVLK